MKKTYLAAYHLFISCSLLLLVVSSCKKDSKNSMLSQTVSVAAPTTLGLYAADSSIYKELDIAISKIGSKSVDYGLVFDTGSGGMVIDAHKIIPDSYITSSGFSFAGDSVVVDGITITNQTNTIAYGADAADADKVYGNLAYADVTIGDGNGSVVVKRLPFFLYYKAVNSKGVSYLPHEFDVFGVNSGYDVTFSNNVHITSPFSYFSPGSGLTKGFKLFAIDSASYSSNFNYVPGSIALGLTKDDLSSSSGFVFSDLTFSANAGYQPIIPATVTYNSKSFSTYVLFDTGTEPYSYLMDPTGAKTETLLPDSSSVNISTNSGFNYSYITSANENLTYVYNAVVNQTDVSIIGLEFFLKNDYLLDFADHKLGVKNK